VESDKEIHISVLICFVYFVCNLIPDKRDSQSAAKVNALLVSRYQ